MRESGICVNTFDLFILLFSRRDEISCGKEQKETVLRNSAERIKIEEILGIRAPGQYNPYTDSGS